MGVWDELVDDSLSDPAGQRRVVHPHRARDRVGPRGSRQRDRLGPQLRVHRRPPLPSPPRQGDLVSDFLHPRIGDPVACLPSHDSLSAASSPRPSGWPGGDGDIHACLRDTSFPAQRKKRKQFRWDGWKSGQIHLFAGARAERVRSSDRLWSRWRFGRRRGLPGDRRHRQERGLPRDDRRFSGEQGVVAAPPV